MYIKAPKSSEQKFYDYLEELRQSGRTNMWSAARYLEIEFGLSEKRATTIFLDWKNGHNDPYRVLKTNTTGTKARYINPGVVPERRKL